MPELFVLVGPPGVGKTTYRDYLEDLTNVMIAANGAEGRHRCVVISQDDLVEEFAKANGLNYTQAFQRADLKAFEREVKARFNAAFEAGHPIILDRTNMTVKSRGYFLRAAKEYRKIAIVFEYHPAVLDDRLNQRAKTTGKTIPLKVMRNMIAAFQAPSWPEFDECVPVRRATKPTIRQHLAYAWRRFCAKALVY
jgi:predicted kinase